MKLNWNKLSFWAWTPLILVGLVISSRTVVETMNQSERKVLGESVSLGSVLADSTVNPVLNSQQQSTDFLFSINVPAKFSEPVNFLKDVLAPNLLYSLTSGKGISLSTGQTPTISNAGVLSLQSKTGELSLEAGSGISLDGLKITNTGITSLSAGTNISIDGNKITNTYSAPAVDYTQSGWTDNGTSITLTTTTDTVTMGSVTAGAITANSLTTSGLALAGGLTVTSGNSILPDTDLGSDLGSSSKRFNNLWVANINSNSSQAFSGQTTFSYAPTDTTLSQASVIINPTTSAGSGQLLYLGVAGYQKALIDEDGDIILGYSDATSAPASDYPLNIYGHSGTRVAYIDTSGNALFAGLTADRIVTSTTGGLLTTSISSANAALSISDETGSGLLVFNTSPLFATDIRTPLVIGSTSANGTLTFEGNNTTGNTSTNANLIFKTGDSAATTAMTILNSGNIGIGTTAPSYKLQVNQTADSNAFRIYGYDDMAAKYGDLYVDASGYTNLYGSDRLYVGALNYTLFTFQGTIIAWLNGTTSMDFFDNKSLNWGNDNDFRVLYDETTDDRLEMSDGTNMFLTIKDQGTASDFAFNTSGLFVKNDGTVGIGTTAPAVTLDVNGKTRIAGTVDIFSSDFGGAGTGKGLWAATGAGNLGLNNYNGAIVFKTDAAVSAPVERMRIDSAGLVGIGTTAPTSKLHVSGAVTGKALAIFDETGDQNILVASASGTNRFVITNAGNVGIGTTAPGAKLDVNGTVNILQDITSSGAIRLMGAASNSVQFMTGGVLRAYFSDTGMVWNMGTTQGLAGSVSAPFYTFAGDANTGTWSSGADTLNISTAGIERVRIDSAGNVGIGTTAPTSKLHVTGAVTGKALAIFDETGDQSLLTASASGVTKFTVDKNGYLLIGTQTVLSTRGGTSNLFVGDAASAGTTDQFNTALGINGLKALNNTDANYNSAVGYNSLQNLTSGDDNTGIGYATLTGLTTGSSNTALGSSAYFAMSAASAGNIAIGVAAGASCVDVGEGCTGGGSTDNNNIYIGNGAGTTSDGARTGNVAIGHNAGSNNSGDYNVFLGYQVGYNETGSNKLYIDNSNTTSPLIWGDFGTNVINFNGSVGIGTTAPTSKLHVNGAVTGKALAIFDETGDQSLLTASASGVTKFTIDHSGNVGIGISPTYALDVKGAGSGVIARFASDNSSGCTLADGGTISCSSDRSLKKNIDGLDYGLSDILKLNPVDFNWNFENDNKTKSLGFIAQDVEMIIPGLVNIDGNGLRSLNTIGLVPVLVKAIQQQQLKIDGLSAATSEATISKTEWNNLLTLVDSIKMTLAEIKNVLTELRTKVTAMAEKFTTKESHQERLCVGTTDKETCVTQEQLDVLIKLIPTPTATSSGLVAGDSTSVVDPTPAATPSSTPTPEITPSEIATSAGNI